MVCLFAACGNTKDTLEKNDSSDSNVRQGEDSDNTLSAVVYFSATGTTEEVAQTIAKVLGTEAFEIIPKEKYSDEDLNYNDDGCRANREMEDDSSRPEIENDLSEITKYDTVYIGFPIWWGTAPRIIQTFLDTCDLSGKTVYTFCTSGSSGIEQSISDLQKLYSDVNIVGGRRFSAGVSEDDVKDWLNAKDK